MSQTCRLCSTMKRQISPVLVVNQGTWGHSTSCQLRTFSKSRALVRDGENLNGFVWSHESPITQMTPKHSVRTIHEQSISARSIFPSSATRQFDSLEVASFSHQVANVRGEIHYRGKWVTLLAAVLRLAVTSLGKTRRSISIQFLNSFP